MGISDITVQRRLKVYFMHFFLNTQTKFLPHWNGRSKMSYEIFQIMPIRNRCKGEKQYWQPKKRLEKNWKKPQQIYSLCSLKNIILTVSADWSFFWYNRKNERWRSCLRTFTRALELFKVHVSWFISSYIISCLTVWIHTTEFYYKGLEKAAWWFHPAADS